MENQLKNESDPIAQIRLVSIKDVELYVADVTELLDAGVDLKKIIGIQWSGKHRVIPEKNLFEIILTLSYVRMESQGGDSVPLLRYAGSIAVEIVNFSEIVEKAENDHYKMPTNLLEMLVQIMISTMRGILVEKMANTPFKYIYVPIMNASDVASEIFS